MCSAQDALDLVPKDQTGDSVSLCPPFQLLSGSPELVANSQPSESGSIPKWQVCQDLFRVRYSKENWGTDR